MQRGGLSKQQSDQVSYSYSQLQHEADSLWNQILMWKSGDDDGDGELTSLSDIRFGQNSLSSSASKDLASSKYLRYSSLALVSVNSRMLLTPRNCLWAFCEAALSRGARRERPLWWLCDGAEAFAAVGWWPL
jgi:hypothetical protein